MFLLYSKVFISPLKQLPPPLSHLLLLYLHIFSRTATDTKSLLNLIKLKINFNLISFVVLTDSGSVTGASPGLIDVSSDLQLLDEM